MVIIPKVGEPLCLKSSVQILGGIQRKGMKESLAALPQEFSWLPTHFFKMDSHKFH